MARAAASATNTQVDELRRANQQLKAENLRLRSQLGKGRTSIWRSLAITLCVILATALLLMGNVLFWAGSTLINTDKYVATVQPLLADKTIQSAIADYTTAQIFHRVDVQAVVGNALPPRADFLAPQLTSQLRGATEKTLQKTLASERFQATWVNVNRKAHEHLISSIKNSKTADGVIDLQDVYDRLGQSLQNTKLGFLAGKNLPDKVGSITVVNAPWIPKARFAVNNIGWLKPVSLVLIAIFSACAIWLARNRRRLIITLASTFALSMAGTLIAVQVIQNRVADHVQPAYHAAVGDAAGIILQPLAHQSWAILAFSALVLAIAWLTGPYRWAKCSVSAARLYLAQPLHKLLFKTENSFTKWCGSNRQTLQWVIVAVISMIMLLVRLSLGLVVIYGSVMLLLALTVEILAGTYSSGKR